MKANNVTIVIYRGKRSAKTKFGEIISLKELTPKIAINLQSTPENVTVALDAVEIEQEPTSNNPDNIDRVSEVLNDCKQINASLRINGVVEWSMNNTHIGIEELSSAVWAHRQRMHKVNIARMDIMTVLGDEISSVYRKQFDEFKAKIAFAENQPDMFDDLAKLISGENYESMNPVVLKHIIWTCKRRIFNLPDFCPILLSFYGSAGKGKTELVKAMFSVIPNSKVDVVSNAKGLFEDDREYFRFVEHYVLVLEELGRVSKAEINCIKSIIDLYKICYRQLGYNKKCEGRNRAQLIGTSNTRLRNTIQSDAEGDIRKWCEIDIAEWPNEQVVEKMVKPLQSFDWLTLWKSVDENGNSPFHDPKVYTAFKDWTAKKCRHESPLVMFLNGIIDKHSGEWLSKEQLYDNGYIHEVKDYQLKWANFKELAEKMGFECHKRKTGIGMLVPESAEEKLKKELISKETF